MKCLKFFQLGHFAYLLSPLQTTWKIVFLLIQTVCMIGEAVLLTFVMGHDSISWMDNAVSPAGIVAGIR